MREWADAYLFAKRTDLKPATLKKIYAPAMQSWCRFCDERGLHHVESIEPDDVRRWIGSLQDHGDSQSYVHQRFRILRNFFRWWEAENPSPAWRSPMRNVKAPKVQRRVLRPVDGDLVRKLFRLANVRDRAILIVMFTTGLRASELVAVDVCDFNRSSGSIFVRCGKGDKQRSVPVPPKARQAIRRWLSVRPAGKSEALFTTYSVPGSIGGPAHGDRLTYWGLREITRRHARMMGLNDIGRHSFRRAAALAYRRAGVPIHVIAQIMGWTIKYAEEMMGIYAEITEEDLQLAANGAALDVGF